jgi:poly(3-hydroxybutyrate) depolymerase
MTPTPADERQETASFIREVVMFPCSGVRCQAWLYLPTSSSNGALPPVVVAAHGLGATADHHSGFCRGAASFPLPLHVVCLAPPVLHCRVLHTACWVAMTTLLLLLCWLLSRAGYVSTPTAAQGTGHK